MKNFRLFVFLFGAGMSFLSLESQAYSEATPGYVEKVKGTYTELGVPVKRTGETGIKNTETISAETQKSEYASREESESVPDEALKSDSVFQEPEEISEDNVVSREEFIPEERVGIVGNVRISRDDPVFVEEVRAVVKNFLNEEKTAPNDGWYFSITAQYNIAETKICGDKTMDTFGATFVLGKELEDSNFDLALMASVFMGDEVDYRSWDWSSYSSSRTKISAHDDILAGIRAGFHFLPASWLTLRFGAMGGLDVLYLKASYSEWYSWNYVDVDKFGFGYFYGLYADAQFNLSKHFSLALETSYLNIYNDLYSDDINLKENLNYITVGASLTFRW